MPQQKINIAIGISICLIVIAAYNLLFFNKYFPFSEGWFSVIAVYMLDGSVPYRDFHFFMPPLYPLILTGFIRIFGADFIYLRIFGILIILSMTTVLFLLFSRLFPGYIVTLITIVSMMYYQSNVAHVPYDFLHLLITFALLGTYFICKYFETDYRLTQEKRRTAAILLFFAGFLGALAFLTKQSNGFYVPVFSLLAITVCCYFNGGLHQTLKSIGIYSIGVSIPISLVLIWLFSKDAFLPFFDHVFKGASQSKGSLGAILFAWIPRLFTLDSVIVLIVVFLAIKALLYRSFLLDKLGDFEKRQYAFPQTKTFLLFWVIFVLSILSIFLPFWNKDLSIELRDSFFMNWIYHRALIITASAVTFVLVFIYLFKIGKERNKLYFDIFIISTASLGLICGTGTSGAVGDAGLILAVGLMFGHLLFARSYFNLGKVIFLAICVFLMLFLASKKYIQPYFWWNLTQPDVRTATQPIKLKYLEGFLLSKETTNVYSEVISIVEKYTKPGDSIYAFPNIPVFYLLTNRRPDTFAIVNWFDVMPDELAIDEAKHILQSPPKIIIWLDIPDFVWVTHENLFRAGKLSGQRKIAMAVKELTSIGDRYSLERKFDLPEGYSLYIWRMGSQ
jgi:hypothetical protein